MQSLRQYRKLRQQVQDQLKNINERGSIHSTSAEPEDTPSEQNSQAEKQYQDIDKIAKLAHTLEGVQVRERTPEEGESGLVFVVGWGGPKDVSSPYNWSLSRRLVALALITCIATSVTATSSIEGAVTQQSSAHFQVSEVAGSLTTGMYLMGFAFGSLFVGSFSETFGRNLVYIPTMVVFMLFIMASALAPNFGAVITFRFLAGFFGSSPLTVSGGTIFDAFTPLEAAWAFPIFAMLSFMGPVLGPVMGAWIGWQGPLSFPWVEWIMLIFAGLVFVLVLCFQPETYSPLLLKWKAYHFREILGDNRFRSEGEIMTTALLKRLRTNVIRPFRFVYTEPIVLIFALYLTILYITLFTFLNGYGFIFTQVYGISQGIQNTLYVAIMIGVFAAAPLIPLQYSWTKKEIERAAEKGQFNRPEIRLWYAMLGGSIAIPVSLFWIGWTCYPSISIWVPIVGSVFFGYGLMTVFTTAYLYIIDVYLIYAASALSFNAFARYLVAGGMTVVGIPMYDRLGPHYTLTLLGCLGVLMAPAPFMLYRWGPAIRLRSRNVVNRQL